MPFLSLVSGRAAGRRARISSTRCHAIPAQSERKNSIVESSFFISDAKSHVLGLRDCWLWFSACKSWNIPYCAVYRNDRIIAVSAYRRYIYCVLCAVPVPELCRKYTPPISAQWRITTVLCRLIAVPELCRKYIHAQSPCGGVVCSGIHLQWDECQFIEIIHETRNVDSCGSSREILKCVLF